MPQGSEPMSFNMAWSSGPQNEPFNPKMVDAVYNDQLKTKNFDPKRLLAFELSRYLENYLWPNYDPLKSTKYHMMSMVLMINTKFRERVDVWSFLRSSDNLDGETDQEEQPVKKQKVFEVSNADKFSSFFLNVSKTMVEDKSLIMKERTNLLIFWTHCVNSIECDIVRTNLQKYINPMLWVNISETRREIEFEKDPTYGKFYRAYLRRDQSLKGQELEAAMFQRTFLVKLIHGFLSILESIPPLNTETKDKSDEDTIEEDQGMDRKLMSRVHYIEKFIDLLIDIESILKTRQFFHPIMEELHLIVRCKNSNLHARITEGHLFRQLLDRLTSYSRFEVDNVTGEQLTDKEMADKHYQKVFKLQRIVFKNFPEKLRKFFVANISSIDSRTELVKHFNTLDKDELVVLCKMVGIIADEESMDKESNYTKEFLIEILTFVHEKFKSQLQSMNNIPLYPTEVIIWDENIVPSNFRSSGTDADTLALPKLNLQFLTLHDYLLRNFELFRLESTYEIRQDIKDAIFRMKPWRAGETDKFMTAQKRSFAPKVMFGGWARMGLGIESLIITEIKKPDIGSDHPSRVRAEVRVNLNVRREIQREWEQLRKHDVCFLIGLDPVLPQGSKFDFNAEFIPQVGLKYVRGCEIEGMLDPHGKLIEDNDRSGHHFDTDYRTYRVLLDCNQFALDTRNSRIRSGKSEWSWSSGRDNRKTEVPDTADLEVYDNLNVIIRRKPKENNFKAVLETIRDIMNTRAVVPLWLTEVLLGFGDPDDANYESLRVQYKEARDELASMKEVKDGDEDGKEELELEPKKKELLKLFKESDFNNLDFNDTFLTFDHLRDSFPGHSIEVDNAVDTLEPPFKLTFLDGSDEKHSRILVHPYKIPLRGPYKFEQPKKNLVKFTPTQVRAVKSGMEPGLTIIVGPPGTGKTDVAVQIISNIYHNYPDQRTLIVTHSNQALNQLFEKIMALDIDERHLLRMGHGETELETDKDMSRYGRVDYVLVQRLALLEKVQRLASSLDLPGDAGSTCETAGFFYLYHIYSKWEEFMAKLNENSDVGDVEKHFPFKKFFQDAADGQGDECSLFKKKSFEQDLEIAKGCFRHIKKIFTQLDEFKAFEMLRTNHDRANYLLIKEAKIIAMTCTHAALKRSELVSIGFQYDNILMEESGQILEIETFIPLLLQNPEHGHNRLKRWIMIGDHHQLPPVIKNPAFQKYSNMEQSLFTRLIKSGVSTIDLDKQGRARSSICSLYRWRYKCLGDLPHILNGSIPEYKLANAGFAFDYQVINVSDFNGAGETEPVAHFFQNLAEAEFVVATYMYMRLVGYPADKITMLTTYNGQKHLIRDIVKQRCESNPFIGPPHKVKLSTVWRTETDLFFIDHNGRQVSRTTK